MDIMGRVSNPQVLEGWERLAASPKGKRPLAEPKPAKNGRPYNSVKRLVIDVLKQERGPLLPAEVQRLIKSATGETLPRSSIKYALWAGSHQTNGAFIREVRGYRLRDDV
jgi:hypothetical protein